MFSKGNKNRAKSGSQAATPQVPAANFGSEPAAVPSIISHDVKIIGDLISDGDVQIDGAIEGNVRSRSLTIGEGAVVEGQLVADTARIYGKIRGGIKAQSVTLTQTARVDGDVGHQVITMEAGARVNGRLTRLDKTDSAKRKTNAGTAALETSQKA